MWSRVQAGNALGHLYEYPAGARLCQHRPYRRAPGVVRRQMNQAIFKGLYVEDDLIAGAALSKPYLRLLAPGLGPRLAREAAEALARGFRGRWSGQPVVARVQRTEVFEALHTAEVRAEHTELTDAQHANVFRTVLDAENGNEDKPETGRTPEHARWRPRTRSLALPRHLPCRG